MAAYNQIYNIITTNRQGDEPPTMIIHPIVKEKEEQEDNTYLLTYEISSLSPVNVLHYVENLSRLINIDVSRIHLESTYTSNLQVNILNYKLLTAIKQTQTTLFQNIKKIKNNNFNLQNQKSVIVTISKQIQLTDEASTTMTKVQERYIV